MIGNDIIDLHENSLVTKNHIEKVFSKEEKNIFFEKDYFLLFSLKESAFKCLQKHIDLQKFIPPHFNVDKDLKTISYKHFSIPILLIDKNNDYIHTIVGLKKIKDYGICDINKYREYFRNSYFFKTGMEPVIVKVKSSKSPNGYSPPILINDPRTSISFSHDGRYSSWTYTML